MRSAAALLVHGDRRLDAFTLEEHALAPMFGHRHRKRVGGIERAHHEGDRSDDGREAGEVWRRLAEAQRQRDARYQRERC